MYYRLWIYITGSWCPLDITQYPCHNLLSDVKFCIYNIDKQQRACHHNTSPITRTGIFASADFISRKEVGLNVASTVLSMRPIEEKDNEPTGLSSASPPTKIEHNVKQMRPCWSMRLIKVRAAAITIMAFWKTQCSLWARLQINKWECNFHKWSRLFHSVIDAFQKWARILLQKTCNGVMNRLFRE